MKAQLVALFLVGAPVPPPSALLLVIAPPSQTITLQWDNSPTVGASNRIYFGVTRRAMTNRFDVGTTNLCRVSVDSTRRYFTVRAVLDGIESVPSNVVKYPAPLVKKECEHNWEAGCGVKGCCTEHLYKTEHCSECRSSRTLVGNGWVETKAKQ